ncbi:hypothetical protein EON65_32940 [archaeon]|nr:MAG: hypothetical protein EON65_32940 [archaeon]
MINQGTFFTSLLFLAMLFLIITLAVPISEGDPVPSAIVDLVESNGNAYNFIENQDFAQILRSHKRAVVFAVPGAFTPTCSTRHLPGFIAQAGTVV